MEAYEELANAIVLRAVDDWRDAVKRLIRRPWNEKAMQRKKEAETFFHSDWFYELTGVEGSVILEKLEKEACV